MIKKEAKSGGGKNKSHEEEKDPKKIIHATRATWTFREISPHITEITAKFDRKDDSTETRKFHARGFIRQLGHLEIPGGPEEPQRSDKIYIVRVKMNNHDLWKFDDFATRHNLLPGLHNLLLLQEEAREAAKIHQKQRYRRLAYRPVRSHMAENTIDDKLEWRRGGTQDAPTVFTITDHPAMAFQAALYLSNNRYMDKSRFWELNTRIHDALQAKRHEEFRIEIKPECCEEFLRQFTHALQEKPPLRAGEIEETYEKLPSKTDENWVTRSGKLADAPKKQPKKPDRVLF